MLLSTNVFPQNNKKIALIIGNTTYKFGEYSDKPVEDAILMATTLRNLDYEVTTVINANLIQIKNATLAFTNNIMNYDEAMFFYAGPEINISNFNYIDPNISQNNNNQTSKYAPFDISDISYAFACRCEENSIMMFYICKNKAYRPIKHEVRRGFKVAICTESKTIVSFKTILNKKSKNEVEIEKLTKQMFFFNGNNNVFTELDSLLPSIDNLIQYPQDWTGAINNSSLTPNITIDSLFNISQNSQTDHGRISIDSKIEGNLYLDNECFGYIYPNSTKNIIAQITTGDHRVEIRGNQRYSGIITIYKNQTTYLAVDQGNLKPIALHNIPSNMVLIKAGEFTMGSSLNEVGRDIDEEQHKITITYDFVIGKYEVSQTEYKYLMNNNPSSYADCENCPVEMISWFDAIKYCNALSIKEGYPVAYDENTGSLLNANGYVTTDITEVQGYRLPTEAEWEYAARAGNTGPFSIDSNLSTNQANYNGNFPYNNNKKGIYRQRTVPVNSLAANAWGLYGMHGNVWEWCHDWRASYFGDATNPIGTVNGSQRVLRGGSWGSDAKSCRLAYRYSSNSTYRYSSYGFRIVRNR